MFVYGLLLGMLLGAAGYHIAIGLSYVAKGRHKDQ